MKHHRATIQLMLAVGACAALSQFAALADTETGLVANYTFKGNARDVSGRGNHGVPSGAVLTDDRFMNRRQAYAFTGDNSRIRAANKPSLNVGPSGITLSAWVYPTEYAGSGERRTILRKMEASGGSGGYLLSLNGQGYPQFGFRSDATSYYEATGTAALPTNQWSHLLLSYDGALAKFFVNGAETTSVAQGGAIGPSTAPLIIGQRGWTNNIDNFIGSLDEIRIYDRAFSNPDVTELFRAQNNQAPNPRIVVLPRSAFRGPQHVLISRTGEPVTVTLNGLKSEDTANDELEYNWYYQGNLVDTGAVTTASLPVGTHPITLQVSDGEAVVEEQVTINVVTVEESLALLRARVESADIGPIRTRNLMVTLNQAARSSENNRLNSRLTQHLFVFENKVRAQLGRTHPQLAEELIQAARTISAAVSVR